MAEKIGFPLNISDKCLEKANFMVNTNNVLLLSMFMLASIPLRGQESAPFQDIASSLQEKLSAYSAANPTSNLYLHLDKTIYSPEETIWFKAYLLGDTAQQAKVLYVRIIDEEKTVVAEAQFPIYDIRAHGCIQLSKLGNTRWVGNKFIFEPNIILLEGHYSLYAYTDRMMVVGDTNVFQQPIRISRTNGRRLEAAASVIDTATLHTGAHVQIKVDVKESGSRAGGVKGEYQLLVGGKELKYGRLTTNTFGEAFVNFTYPELADHESLKMKLLFTQDNDYTELALNLPHRGNPVTVNCFPEGGRVVPGGRVTIEALDILGNPVPTGLRVMKEDSTIASLTTDVLGIVTTELPQTAGVRYTVKVAGGRGQTIIDVPSADRLEGFSLKLRQDSTGSSAVVRNHGRDSTALLVLRTNRGILWSAEQEILPDDSATVLVPANKFPKDILSLSVFGGNGTPHAERLFLNKDEDDYRISINTEQHDYGTKRKVIVRLRVTDSDGIPVAGNLSVSATEKGRWDSTTFRSILQNRYYGAFDRHVRSRLSAANRVDRLLFGRQWQYSGWDAMLADTMPGMPVYLPSMNGVTGIVVGMQSKPNYVFVPMYRKIEQVHLYAVKEVDFSGHSIESSIARQTIPVNPEDNTFFIPDTLLFSRSGREWQLDIPIADNQPWRFQYLVEWQDPNIRFDSTVMRDSRLFLPPKLSSYAVANAPSASAFDFQGVNLLQEVVIGRKEKPLKRGLRKTNCEQYEEMIRQHDTKRLMRLEKGKPHPFGYTYSGEGKVIIYLGCGRYRDINYIRNITIPDDFPLPDYEAGPTAELDMRSTVYWNPNVYTDADGTATFSFFTSDVTGEFEIVAQGLVESTLRPLMGTGRFKVTN